MACVLPVCHAVLCSIMFFFILVRPIASRPPPRSPLPPALRDPAHQFLWSLPRVPPLPRHTGLAPDEGAGPRTMRESRMARWTVRRSIAAEVWQGDLRRLAHSPISARPPPLPHPRSHRLSIRFAISAEGEEHSEGDSLPPLPMITLRFFGDALKMATFLSLCFRLGFGFCTDSKTVRGYP